MQKVIIDTNVLISAFIQKSYPYFILYDCIFEGQVEICLSDELLEEYLDVLNRPKFSRYPDFLSKAEFIIAQIESKSIKFYPKERIEVISDTKDNRLLELAVESTADFIITGNTKDFTMTEYKGTNVVTPKEYWELYRPE